MRKARLFLCLIIESARTRERVSLTTARGNSPLPPPALSLLRNYRKRQTTNERLKTADGREAGLPHLPLLALFCLASVLQLLILLLPFVFPLRVSGHPLHVRGMRRLRCPARLCP